MSKKLAAGLERFREENLQHPAPPNAVVFAGSSSIERWPELAAAFPQWPVLNRGIGSSTLRELMEHCAEWVTPCKPARVVIYSGSHDLHVSGESPAQVLETLKNLVSHIHADTPSCRIQLIGLKPSPAKWDSIALDREFNRLAESWAAASGSMDYVDTWNAMMRDGAPDLSLFTDDRNHLSALGYQCWERLLRAAE